ncbi:hypothetical protein Tco_1016929 [Tanacetum coccineum]|uniref:Uncharacterized protein n=1 Tax=Tanacetum coccineum TaxID=301880 RepID=A0ABQ5FR35_9ASTR
MSISLGFEINEFPNYVSKLDKALYGLKQAPRSGYLKGTPSLGLWYSKVSGFDLKAYLEFDYAGCNLDRKSTSGGCLIHGIKLVCWSAKKQNSVAMSSAEAEYVATAGCCAHVPWMKSQLADYEIHYDKIQRISLTGFPAQSVGSSNTNVLDSPCLLVLITGTSQSTQHVSISSIHVESCKSPTVVLFDDDTKRISIHHLITKGISKCSRKISRIMRRALDTHMLFKTRFVHFGFSNRRLELTATYSISTISD